MDTPSDDDEGDWIDRMLKRACDDHPVAEAISTALSGQLRTNMSQRALRSSELSTIAANLIAINDQVAIPEADSEGRST